MCARACQPVIVSKLISILAGPSRARRRTRCPQTMLLWIRMRRRSSRERASGRDTKKRERHRASEQESARERARDAGAAGWWEAAAMMLCLHRSLNLSHFASLSLSRWSAHAHLCFEDATVSAAVVRALTAPRIAVYPWRNRKSKREAERPRDTRDRYRLYLPVAAVAIRQPFWQGERKLLSVKCVCARARARGQCVRAYVSVHLSVRACARTRVCV